MKKSTRIFCLAILIAFSVSSHSVAGDLQAGFATRSITPDFPVSLGGYSARQQANPNVTTTVHDLCEVRTMALLSDGELFVFATLDVCLTPSDLRISCWSAIREAISTEFSRARFEFPQDHYLSAASHTHSGPGGIVKPVDAGTRMYGPIGMGVFSQELYDFVIDSVKSSAIEAIRKLEPVTIGFGLGEETRLSGNRCVSEGPIDPDVFVIKVTKTDGTLLGVVVDFAAHGVCAPDEVMEVSADHAGAFCRNLMARYEGVTVLYLNGAEGDIHPKSPTGSGGHERAADFGRFLADKVQEMLPGIAPYDVKTIFASDFQMDSPPGVGLLGMLRPPKITIGCIAFDKRAILLNVPGEMVCELGFKIKDLAKDRGFEIPAIVGLANEHMGYFVHAEGYTEENKDRWSYEKSLNPWGQRTEGIFVDLFKTALDKANDALDGVNEENNEDF
ncbi:MAG: hypothetical protein NUW37_10040 [Planctomycetes bacterium]|nr:hypothetical protein [Planctomycetota bacterium]